MVNVNIKTNKRIHINFWSHIKKQVGAKCRVCVFYMCATATFLYDYIFFKHVIRMQFYFKATLKQRANNIFVKDKIYRKHVLFHGFFFECLLS